MLQIKFKDGKKYDPPEWNARFSAIKRQASGKSEFSEISGANLPFFGDGMDFFWRA